MYAEKKEASQLASFPLKPPTISSANVHLHNSHIGILNVQPPSSPAPDILALQQKLKEFYIHTCHSIQRVIPRLPRLPIERCFINLAVIEKQEQSVDEKKSLEKAMTATGRADIYSSYEDIYSRKEKRLITPEKLFKDKNNNPIDRVLQIGRAGIGKSTANRHSSYYWARGDLWQEFKLVFDIKARNLKKAIYQQGSTLAHIIREECFDKTKEVPSIEEINALLRAYAKKQILIKIDGFDELALDSACKDTIQQLVMRPRNKETDSYTVIVYTRPFTEIRESEFDEVVECMGFATEDISKFIALPELGLTPKVRESILAFLKRHSEIRNLMHVPLLLDMLCAGWNEELAQVEHLTITQLFEHLLKQFWRNYGDNRRQHTDTKEIEQTEKDTEAFLQKLAFMAMQANKILLDSDMVENALKAVFPNVGSATLTRYLNRLLDAGFLNSPDGRNYYFPHLTFQEFFAAKYLENYFIELQKWIGLEAYNPRYNILWCFLGGLLRKKSKQLEQFLQLVEGKLAKQTHYLSLPVLIRIAEECEWDLSESRKTDLLNTIISHFEGLFAKGKLYEYPLLDLMQYSRLLKEKRIEQLFLQWLKRKNYYFKRCLNFLIYTRDDPKISVTIKKAFYKVLLDRLEKGNKKARKKTLEILKERMNLGNHITFPIESLLRIVSWLESQNEELNYISNILFGNQKRLPAEILFKFVELLENSNERITKATCGILSQQLNLPAEIYPQLSKLLDNKNEEVRCGALGVFYSRRNLPVDILIKLVDLLKDENDSIKQTTVSIFERETNLPAEVITKISNLLDNGVTLVQVAAVSSLKGQKFLSAKVLLRIIDFLYDYAKLKEPALYILSGQEVLPTEIYMKFESMLESTNGRDVFVAINALGVLIGHPAKIVQKLVSLLDSKFENIKEAASFALREQGPFSTETLWKITGLLEYKSVIFPSVNDSIRKNAEFILQNQKDIPVEILLKMIDLLESNNKAVAEAAKFVLTSKSNLPTEIILKLEILLKNEDEKIIEAAVSILKSQNIISLETLIKFVELLESRSETMYSTVMFVLGDRILTNEILLRIFVLLETGNALAQYAAAHILQTTKILPVEILLKLITLCDHESEQFKKTAINVLCERNILLPIEILLKSVELLESKNKQLKKTAILFWNRQYKVLPVNILLKLIDLLEDGNKKIRDTVLIVLNRQEILPIEAILRLGRLLGSKSKRIKQAALSALEQHNNLPAEVLLKIGELINNSNIEIKKAALSILEKSQNIPIESIRKVENLLLIEFIHYLKIKKNAISMLVESKISSIEMVGIVENLLLSQEPMHYLLSACKILANQIRLTSQSLNMLSCALLIDHNELKMKISEIINSNPDCLYQIMRHLCDSNHTQESLLHVRDDLIRETAQAQYVEIESTTISMLPSNNGP